MPDRTIIICPEWKETDREPLVAVKCPVPTCASVIAISPENYERMKKGEVTAMCTGCSFYWLFVALAEGGPFAWPL